MQKNAPFCIFLHGVQGGGGKMCSYMGMLVIICLFHRFDHLFDDGYFHRLRDCICCICYLPGYKSAKVLPSLFTRDVVPCMAVPVMISAGNDGRPVSTGILVV